MKVLQLIAGLDIGGLHGGAERFGAHLALALNAGGSMCFLADRLTR
jgi:hypothetical protein